MRVTYTTFDTASIVASAEAAARSVNRRLGGCTSPGQRSVLSVAEHMRTLPYAPCEGALSFTWLLEGAPGLVAKVLATPQRSAVRSWHWAASVINCLEPAHGLNVPRIRGRGNSPAPWVIQDEAPLSAATTSRLAPTAALDVVLGVGRSTLWGGPRLQVWGRSRYAANILKPLAALEKAGALSPGACALARDLAHRHLEQTVLMDPVLVHNDLGVYHLFLDDTTAWIIDWVPHMDRLLLLDVAHLMVHHGKFEPAWAESLGQLALDHYRQSLGADLTSNLIVCLLERVVGLAYDSLRRKGKPSIKAAEALCAIMDHRLSPGA